MKYSKAYGNWNPISNIPHIFRLYKKLGLVKGKVLDVGCSHGWFVEHYLKSGIDAYGVDVDETIKYDERIRKCDLNKERIPFEDNTFDFIQVHSVIEYLTDVHHFMKEIIRVLKPGGKLAITSYILNWRTRDKFWNEVFNVKPYPPKALKRLFLLYDLDVVLCEPKFAGRTWMWKLPGFVKWRLGSFYLIVGRKNASK